MQIILKTNICVVFAKPNNIVNTLLRMLWYKKGHIPILNVDIDTKRIRLHRLVSVTSIAYGKLHNACHSCT